MDQMLNVEQHTSDNELSEHCDKTRNQTPHKTTKNTTPQLDDEITKTKKGKLDICKNHLFRLKEKRKKDVEE
ncbi:hypothetical protein MTR_3g060680 [Medicago truncatula]|uniref:Uncharacterized protein n=1 Tax=Medicago truncatula TaxID=3880 RepID=G7IXS1_MEDTR|nr:hypothetical protein MTR_3g060680 [Medicago truncatula]